MDISECKLRSKLRNATWGGEVEIAKNIFIIITIT